MLFSSIARMRRISTAGVNVRFRVKSRPDFRAYRSGSSPSLRMMEKSLSRSIVTVFFMRNLS